MQNPYRPSIPTEPNDAPRFIVPIANTTIVLASITFVLGVVIPFAYSGRAANPSAQPLPSYLRWVNVFDQTTFAIAALSVPLFFLTLGVFARSVAPSSVLRYIPWWKTDFDEVLRRHKREKPSGEPCDAHEAPHDDFANGNHTGGAR